MNNEFNKRPNADNEEPLVAKGRKVWGLLLGLLSILVIIMAVLTWHLANKIPPAAPQAVEPSAQTSAAKDAPDKAQGEAPALADASATDETKPETPPAAADAEPDNAANLDKQAESEPDATNDDSEVIYHDPNADYGLAVNSRDVADLIIVLADNDITGNFNISRLPKEFADEFIKSQRKNLKPGHGLFVVAGRYSYFLAANLDDFYLCTLQPIDHGKLMDYNKSIINIPPADAARLKTVSRVSAPSVNRPQAAAIQAQPAAAQPAALPFTLPGLTGQGQNGQPGPQGAIEALLPLLMGGENSGLEAQAMNMLLPMLMNSGGGDGGFGGLGALVGINPALDQIMQAADPATSSSPSSAASVTSTTVSPDDFYLSPDGQWRNYNAESGFYQDESGAWKNLN